VADAYIGKNGKLSWTSKLAGDPRVRQISACELTTTL